MPIEDEKPAAYDDNIPFTYLLLASLSVLFVGVVVPTISRRISHVIHRRNLSAVAWSKKVALIVASNRMDSYKAEEYCTVCFSSATHRCSSCGAVAYCSKKCQRDHWKQGHREECLLMDDIEAIANEAKGQEINESNKRQDFLRSGDDEDYLACAHCDSQAKASLWFWSEFDIFSFGEYEKDHRIRYLTEESPPFVNDAGESANDAYELEIFAPVPEYPSAFEQETWATVWSCEIPRFIALARNEKGIPILKGCCSKCEVVFHCYRDCQRYHWTNDDQKTALENGCCNSCIAILSCSDHCQRYEWINGHKEPQQVDDVGESTKSSEFEQSISHAQTMGESATDNDKSPRRVTRRNPAADHATIRHRYPTTLVRSSSSSSADSSCATCSMDASGSDAISSLHDLD